METCVQAEAIGRVIKQARLDNGFKSRASLVETKKLKGVLTQEGLRKIEGGERVPKLENLHALAGVLGLGVQVTKALEKLALEANIKRVTRRAGNASVSFIIDGKPVKIEALPPKRKVEKYVREVVDKLVVVVAKYGVLEADLQHFRMNARHILLSNLKA